jgi:hypothetical protein
MFLNVAGSVSQNGSKIRLGHILTSQCAMSADDGGRICTKAEMCKRRQVPWSAPVVPVLVYCNVLSLPPVVIHYLQRRDCSVHNKRILRSIG